MTKRDFSKFLIVLVLFASGIVTNIHSQEFNATVNRTIVGQYDRFQVDFSFNGADINNVKNFRPPNFDGFKILSGPNQSTSMQFINGKVSGTISFSYILQPIDIGDFIIGVASVDYQGNTYKTSPLKIKVEKGTPQQQRESTGGYSEEELAKNVFILAEANKKRVLIGEQLTITYKLYTKLNISSPQITKLPQYQGFWAEEIEPIKTINFELGMYNGERYRVATIKQVALFPTKIGTLNVTPFELNIPVIVKKKRTGNDIFDDFFNDSFFGRSETIEYKTKSNTLKIEVEPLPTSNVPASFTGAVGNFNFKAEIDKNKAFTNESITLRLTASGSGNIKLLKIPEIQLPPGFEKYEPKVYENINKGSVISGQKIVEYLIVPRSPGENEIPSIEFSYFNPSTRNYVTQNSPKFQITVVKGEGQYEPIAESFAKEDVKLLGEDIRYIKTSDFDLERKQEISFIKPWFWISLILPTLALLLSVGYKKRQDKLYGNISLMKFQKAERAAKLRLRTAKKMLDGNQLENFYSELSLALNGYLEDKLGIQKSEFTLDSALAKLTMNNLDTYLIDKVRTISEQCEFVRFSPQGISSSSAQEIYDQTVNVIVEVDSLIGKKK